MVVVVVVVVVAVGDDDGVDDAALGPGACMIPGLGVVVVVTPPGS